jgi:hypothetical protein
MLIMMFSTVGSYPSEAAENNILMFPEIHLNKNETGTFGLLLSNEDVVEALQFRFTYNSLIGFQITGVALTSRTMGFEPPVWQINDNDPEDVEVLVVLYSLQEATISPGSGDILTFHYRTSPDVFGRISLMFTETVLANTTATSAPVSSEDGTVTTKSELPPATHGESIGPLTHIPEPATLAVWIIGLYLLGIYVKTHFH